MLICCLSVVFLTLLLHICLMDRELPAPFYVRGKYDIWCIHHDEKLVIPDARWLYLKKKKIAFIEDYKPWPVLSVFGWLGPCLPAWGFRLMGLNNRGLRLPALVIGAMLNLFTVLLAWKILDPWSTMAVTLTVCLNYQFFILRHHYIIENILGTAILILILLFTVNPVQFVDNVFLVAFGCSSLALIKPNFPVTLWILTGCLLAASGADAGNWLFMMSGTVCGFAIFEGIQFAVTRPLGIAKYRWINLMKALQVHSGREHEFLQKHFKPVGWRLFIRFPLLVLDWFFSTTSRNLLPTRQVPIVIATVFWAAMAVILKAGGVTLAGTVLFIVVMILSGMPFYYYPKRVVPLLIPVLLVLFKVLQPLTIQFSAVLWMVLFLVGIILVFRSYQAAFSQVDHGVAERSQAIKNLIPKGSTIYMHCYPYRFAWQIDTSRVISGDDQWIDNKRILDMALVEKNAYFILEDLTPDQIGKLETEHDRLAIFHCPMSQCDLPKNFYLFRHRNNDID